MSAPAAGESDVERRLAAAGFSLPQVVAPLASYVPALVHAGQVFTAGQLPLIEGALPRTGLVGASDGVSPEEAQDLARVCALNGLAAVKAVIGDLDRIERVLKLTGFVASSPGFAEQAMVINGASDVMAIAFNEAGAHARSAVGVAALPFEAPVEVEFLFALAG